MASAAGVNLFHLLASRSNLWQESASSVSGFMAARGSGDAASPWIMSARETAETRPASRTGLRISGLPAFSDRASGQRDWPRPGA
ncbi:MAG: hypothetical protein CMN76_17200 [Spirochaetaceae bacterium]|nr:hypothetical protein [Spirochaetaceae bacterium]